VHLIGTQNRKGITNLGVFSNVVHIGANPPLIGIIFRPAADVPRNSLQNILLTQQYTLNAIGPHMLPNAHLASAKLPMNESEFDLCELTPSYREDWEAPFVEESPIQIALSLQEIVPIKANNTQLVIGRVQHVFIHPDFVPKNGRINFEEVNAMATTGLNTYYALKKVKEYPYVYADMQLKDFHK
jgi:flavin reductase (DIM6/NTAB) family NADH-FMN oxidoreductase RutF